VINEGFEVFEDVEDKPGLIGSQVGSRFVCYLSTEKFDRPAPKSLIVMVGYMASYAGMGEFQVRLLIAPRCHDFKISYKNSKVVSTSTINGQISKPVSIYTTHLIWPDEASSSTFDEEGPFCHFLEVTIQNDIKLLRKEHKVKLLDLVWAPHRT
jgi:hypothetical protein